MCDELRVRTLSLTQECILVESENSFTDSIRNAILVENGNSSLTDQESNGYAKG